MKESDNFSFSIQKRSVYSTLLFVATLIFSYFQFIGYIIPGLIQILKLNKEMEPLQQLRFFWIPIITYILISLNICLFIRIFKYLKEHNEEGLINRLIYGFKISFIVCLIISVIAGAVLFITNLNSQFTEIRLETGVVASINFGLTIGTFIGIFPGFISGIFNEFWK